MSPDNDFQSFKVGDSWGATWETTWIKAKATIPEGIQLGDGDRLEAVVDLGWFDHSSGFQAEGLVRDRDGKILKAINPRNRWIPLSEAARDGKAGATVEFSIEAAANPLLLAVPPFQKTYDGDKLTSTQSPIYRLARAEVAVLHYHVYHLALDLAVLRELAETKAEDDAWGWKLWLTLSEALDALDLDDIPGTAERAREVLRPVLDTPAEPFAHQLSAIGHAHIDSAWLWPIRETRRKSVRTLANVMRLVEDGTGLVFALPAAQHLQWVKEEAPELFERIKAAIADGSIVPVGGMWIEPDAVLPGGEALCRQLIHGLRFFEEETGATCNEIWLPDSFGYSGAIPQIARLAGVNHFLTQKISWNQVDTFPHHTLLWEGIDGSRIFTHFPPVDTYGAEVTGHNLAHAEKNFKDKGRATCSMMPFGYGDGGGGPTREMIERIDRVRDLRGAPQTKMETPAQFFARAEADYPNPPLWVGELYLELHRGTFTSQIKTKQGNRRSESWLREAELWAALAATYANYEYPYDQLDQAWKSTLLCQFHDILPGTSIAWVYREVEQLYAQVQQTCEEIIAEALAALTTGDTPSLANATSFRAADVPALAIGVPTQLPPTQVGDNVLDNGLVRAQFDADGHLISLEDKTTGREYIPAGQRGGELHLHQDFPNMWDAWDLDPFYRGSQTVLENREFTGIDEDGTARVRVRFGKSVATLTWSLPAGQRGLDLQVDLDWQETEKILKLSFPVDIHTDHAQYETQMGYLTRPTHENTSWEAYKFEVSCHRWLRLANPSASLAIANDATYGWDVTRHAHAGRGTWSLVRASLARAAQFPDPEQDRGQHTWKFQLLPGASVREAVAAGQALNLPPREVTGSWSLAGESSGSPIEVTGAVVESVSLAPDRSGDLVVRVYEPEGGETQATLRVAGATRMSGVDLRYRENDLGVELTHLKDEQWAFHLQPFEIATIRVEVKK
ncbi:MAG: glycoside hydrolase family 38 C-terminal domain-containing protein [Actinomycetaceae bacterium]|nr:glycoside hydrolase family 38 C-terminal domain-containing protein [Actinomycetaceae bacterium]